MQTTYTAQERKVEENETVKGQLANFSDRDNSYLQRIAQGAKDKAASRGLTNSSISIGNAQGAVIDKAGEFAMKDAEIYSMASRDNQAAVNDAGKSNSSNNTNLKVNTDRNDAEALRQTGINANQLKMQTAGDAAASARQEGINKNQRLIQTAGDKAAMARQDAELINRTELGQAQIASNELVANKQIEATAAASQLERENRIRVATMGDEAAAALEKDKQVYESKRDTDISYQSAYSDFQAGLASINADASPTSQNQQFSRLSQAFNSRMGFLDVLYTPSANGEAGSPAPTSTPSPSTSPLKPTNTSTPSSSPFEPRNFGAVSGGGSANGGGFRNQQQRR